MSSIFMHTSGLPDSQSHQSCALREYHDGAFKQRIQVSLPANLTTEEFAKLLPGVRQYTPAYGFPALKNWFWRLYQNLQLQDDETHPFNKHPYKLRKLEIQAVDWFWRDRPDQEDKLGFMKLQAKIETDPYLHEGEAEERADWLPGAVFLRGGSVAILIIVQPEDATDEDEKHVILTIQPRIAAASLGFTEIPAGMLDGNSFRGTAARELEEEAKLNVKETDLVNMSELALEAEQPKPPHEARGVVQGIKGIEDGIYPSPGACDEFIPLFLCQKRLKRAHMEWLKGKATGLRDEGENITLRLVPLHRAWRELARDGKGLAALSLYENLRREGGIPAMPEEAEDAPDDLEG